MLSDLIVSLRQLRRTPVQTIIAILTLALGIGLSTTMGSLLKALVLDPFRYPEPDRIVQVWNSPGWPLSMLDFVDLKEQGTSFESLGAYSMDKYNVSGDVPVTALGAPCTSGIFPALGVKPQMGRWMQPEDELPGAAPVAVISHSLWQSAFAGDEKVIGRHAMINGFYTEIIGVMPADFEFLVTFFSSPATEPCLIWTPLHMFKAAWDPFADRGMSAWIGLGRLREGVSVGAADAEAKEIAKRLSEQYPQTNSTKPFTVRSLRTELVDGIGPMLPGTGPMNWLLFGAGIFVLLVACVNVACLLVAQGTARQREFSIRLALGASRWHVVRLLMMESLVLACAGALLGLLVASWSMGVLARFAPIPNGHEALLHVDAIMVLFTAGLVLVGTFLVGLPPAFAARDMEAADVLRASGRGQAGSKSRQRLLRMLVIGQVAIALLVANTAALFLASYQKVISANSTLGTTQVLAASLSLKGERYDSMEKRLRFLEQLLERVNALPGVDHAGTIDQLPLAGGRNRGIQVGAPGSMRRLGPVEITFMSPDYFSAQGLVLLKGKIAGPSDSNGIVVNRALAEQAWPDEEAIGQKVFSSDSANPDSAQTVIGVVDDVRQWSADTPARPQIYMYYATKDMFNGLDQVFLVVRSKQDARPLASLLQREIAGFDPDLPLGELHTMSGLLSKSTQYRRFVAGVLAVFTFCTVGLAMLGIYGTLSYYVTERTREIGVRVALGATRTNVVSIVMKRVGFWLLIGLVLGIGSVFWMAQLLRALLYEMQPVNPPMLMLSVIIVFVAGLFAGLLPALRATRITPLEALRAD